jgi:hypothetical protein
MIPSFLSVFIFQLNRFFGAEIDAGQTKETVMLPYRPFIHYSDIFSRTDLLTYPTSITGVIHMKTIVNFWKTPDKPGIENIMEHLTHEWKMWFLFLF